MDNTVAGTSSPARRSPRVSSMSATCSSTRSSPAAASARCQTGARSGLGFSSWDERRLRNGVVELHYHVIA